MGGCSVLRRLRAHCGRSFAHFCRQVQPRRQRQQQLRQGQHQQAKRLFKLIFAVAINSFLSSNV